MLKIRSKYIIRQIFENISEKKKMQLLKCSKKIQNIMDISLKSYKIYNQIEIELIPILSYKKEDKFINGYNKDKSFIHIYINNNKRKEFNFYRLENKTKITKIRIVFDNELKSFKGLFKDCNCLEEIKINKCNRKDILDMSEMFSGCENLIKLELSNLKTDKVVDMSYMFSNCSSLKNINLLNFNTSNVINMQNMFEKCKNITQLNLNDFNTSNVIYMNE